MENLQIGDLVYSEQELGMIIEKGIGATTFTREYYVIEWYGSDGVYIASFYPVGLTQRYRRAYLEQIYDNIKRG